MITSQGPAKAISPSNLRSLQSIRRPPRRCSMVSVRASGQTRGTSQSRCLEASELKGPLQSPDSKATLYTHVLCPYAQRAWLVLLEKGVQFDLVNVDLSSKPRWYTELNPAALVPAVEWRGHIQTESLDICRWVDTTFEGPTLIPSGTGDRVQKLIEQCADLNATGMSLLAGANGRLPSSKSFRSWGIGSGQSDHQKQQFSQKLRRLSDAFASSGGPFLTGSAISLADIVYYPFLERFAIAMPAFCGYNVREDSHIDSWLKAMTERPSVKTCSPDASLFLQALKKHMSLDFFDFHTYTASALHPHLREA